MRRTTIVAVSLFFVVATIATSVVRARADGNINAVNHIIIMMQENHSFDNYFGVLPYVSGGPYHPGPCRNNDHSCVDGLTCFRFQHGNLFCLNFNFDQDSGRYSRSTTTTTVPVLTCSTTGRAVIWRRTFSILTRRFFSRSMTALWWSTRN